MVENLNDKPVIIWIEQEDTLINSDQSNTLDSFQASRLADLHMKIDEFLDVQKAIQEIKKIDFKETIIIVDENKFSDFVIKFNENITDINIIPQIIIHSEKKKKTFEIPNNIQNKSFYNNNVKTLANIQRYLESIQNESEEPNNPAPKASEGTNSDLIFEGIKEKTDMKLPYFYKILLDVLEIKDNKFIETMEKYKKDKNYKSLVNPILNIKDIPIELLSKYYARMYTVEGNFFEKMKKDLIKDYNAENIIYQSYIKTMYEGVNKKALKTLSSFDGIELYSAQAFTDGQIKEINNYKKNRGNDFKVYSKLFLSFTKDKDVALQFMKKDKKNILITIESANNKFRLDTHTDIEKLSFYGKEKEVLFFPFSAFEITEFSPDNKNTVKEKEIYIMKLKYFGRFMQDYELKKKFNIEKDILPEPYFKKLFIKSGLIEKEKIDKMRTKNDKTIEVKLPPNRNDKMCKCTIKKIIIISIIIVILAIIGVVIYITSKSKKDKNNNSVECEGGFYLDSLSNCLPCGIGYYSNKGATYCSRCQNGYSSGERSSSCYPCKPGTFSNDLYLSCTDCNGGYYSSKGSSSCNICPAGSYSNDEKTACFSCNRGYYSNSGASECTKCPSGYIALESGESYCSICSAGTYSNEDRTNCISCMPGYYSDEGASHCTICPSGTFSSNYYSFTCYNCPAGSYSFEGSSYCTFCSPGYYSNEGASYCIKCDNNSFTNIEGATSCINCPIGLTSNSNRTSCICPKGYYYSSYLSNAACVKCQNGTYSNIENSSSCINCPSGYTSNEDNTDCIKCPMGYYSSFPGSICQKCPIGYYSNSIGATSCQACYGGSTSNNDRTYCIQCQRGYYSPLSGSDCIECPNGTYSSYGGATYCTLCTKGYTSNYNHTRCVACPIGYYAPNIGSPSCIPCPEGYITNSIGSSSCIKGP